MYIETSVRGLLTVFFRRQKKFYFIFAFVLFAGAMYLSGMERWPDELAQKRIEIENN